MHMFLRRGMLQKKRLLRACANANWRDNNRRCRRQLVAAVVAAAVKPTTNVSRKDYVYVCVAKMLCFYF